jgi:hypothetical protein
LKISHLALERQNEAAPATDAAPNFTSSRKRASDEALT